MTTTLPQPTSEQANVIDGLLEFAKLCHSDRPPSFLYTTLGGYAGTGKTVTIKHLVSALNDTSIYPVAVLALAGKAVHVLRKKGLHWAQTIHSYIYDAIPNGDGTFSFVLKPKIEAELIIVDEASMVSQALFNDLLSFGVPVIFVGDHGQLEPIGDNPRLMELPQFRLETIHRQALDSPILNLAHRFREGETPRAESTGGLMVTTPNRLALDPRFQYICGYNDYRHQFNRQMRDKLGFHTAYPSPGEKIIVLRNNHEHGLFNGMMGTVTEAFDAGRGIWCVSFTDDAGVAHDHLPFVAEQFGSSKKDIRKPFHEPNAVFGDFGYCITCHKAQGSEWDNVAVIEQGSSLWSMSRWRYTAATRASQVLHYFADSARPAIPRPARPQGVHS